jgi:hypothetical protein
MLHSGLGTHGGSSAKVLLPSGIQRPFTKLEGALDRQSGYGVLSPGIVFMWLVLLNNFLYLSGLCKNKRFGK